VNLSDGLHWSGTVSWRLIGPGGVLRAQGSSPNLITRVGAQMYSERGAGFAGAPLAPTGMKLGTGSTNAAASVDPGAHLDAYLAGSQRAFDSGWPHSALNGTMRELTFQTTWGPGVVITATPITEVVIVNEVLTDFTSSAGTTVSRALLVPPIPLKGSNDTIVILWIHQGQAT
jgi:hypothetical protein